MKEFIVLSVFSVIMVIIINIFLFNSSFFKDDESYTISDEVLIPKSEKYESFKLHTPESNMKDCQEKGGEYVLWITPAGEVQVEKCKIDREIYYHNK